MSNPDFNEDELRKEAFIAAFRRGDQFATARLACEEWKACRVLWAASPLRHLVLGIAIALILRVFREVCNGPLVIDLLGLIALLWYGGKTLLAILLPSNK